MNTVPTRSGNLPKRNERLQDIEKQTHARNQAELVEAIMLERTKGRLGLKTQVLSHKNDKFSPASKLNKMSQEDTHVYFNNILKSHKVIQRLEVYKDERLLEDDYFNTAVTGEKFVLSPNVFKSLIHLSERLSLEFKKVNVVGIDINAEGEMWLYYARPEEKKIDPPVSSGRLKKAKEAIEEELKEEKVEEVEIKSAVRISYLVG